MIPSYVDSAIAWRPLATFTTLGSRDPVPVRGNAGCQRLLPLLFKCPLSAPLSLGGHALDKLKQTNSDLVVFIYPLILKLNNSTIGILFINGRPKKFILYLVFQSGTARPVVLAPK